MSSSPTGRGSATPRGPSTLGRLVALDRTEFAEQVWGRGPLLSRAPELPQSFEDLFSAEAVDELLACRGLRTPFLRVAKDGATLGDGAFTSGGGVGAAITDQVSDDKLLALFADGATIVLQGLHRIWPAVIQFTQHLAGELGHAVQANAYVTPRQSTGFSDHYDVHDVFVLQVSGAKRWRVRPPVRRSPTRDEPWTGRRQAVERAASEPPLLEATLRAGDCLYLPRGYLHSATACGDVSIHLTLGVHVWTRLLLAEEIVAAALAALQESEPMRASLPLGVDVTDAASVAPDLEAAWAALTQTLGARPADRSGADESLHSGGRVGGAGDLGDRVLARLHARTVRSQRAAPIGPIGQTRALDTMAQTRMVRLRDALCPRLAQDEDGSAVLVSRATAVRVAPADRASVEALLREGRAPTEVLGTELTRRLLVAGIVLPAADGSTGTDAGLSIGTDAGLSSGTDAGLPAQGDELSRTPDLR